MYQISAYISKNKKVYENIRGILIYPSNGYEFHEKYVSPESYFIEFKTLDLSKNWNNRESKYDLRDWAPEHEKMGKGVTLTNEELKELRDILNNMDL